MSVFRILAEELENWYNNQPIVSLVNETEGKKLYYHGRNSFRPYSGKYIFITDDLGYASGYGDGKILYSYSLPFGEDRLFSIKNPNHLALLEKYIDPYTISMIFNSSGQNQEIDWAALSYISTDEFEEPEDLFKHLGFYGIKLKERTGINSLYIFDQDDLTFEGTIDLTTPEMQDKIRQFYQNFTKDKNFLQEERYKVYHGTNEKFGRFNLNKTAQGIVWFTDSIDSIQKGEHGGQGNKYIMTRYITINNPAGWEEYEKYGLQQLQDMGYDGVILPQGDKTDYFVFSNKNISAKEPVNLTEEDDYRGYHTAPTSEDSPMYDVTNTFGEDMYTDRALRMFGGYGQYDGYSIALIQRARNKPNMPVKIYRAIPAILTNQEKINDYEKQKAYILKTGKLPKDVDNWRNSSEYYDWISNEIDRLKALPPEQDAKAKINNGDWVTINPAYAKVHGQSNLNNKFKVLSKTVPAKNLFTDGNSIHEWGYVGNDLNEEINDNNITITPKDIKLVGNIKTNGYESIIEAYVYPNQSRTPIKYEFLSSIMLDKYSYKINGIFNQQPKSFNDKDLIKIDVVLDYENVENYIANRNNISTAIKNQFKKQLADKLNQSSQTIDERKKKRQLGMALPLGQIYSAGFASEGVADKYAEREFNIPDTGVDADYQATRMIQPDLSMGEYIGDLKQDGKFLTRVFKNPKNLNKFDKNSRAVSDKYGNLFVAEKDVPFYHSELQKFLEKYGNVNEFMQWYRYGTNIFTLSGSYNDLYKINDRELEQEYYDNVKKRNPQYKFLFTMRNPDVTNEGIADDARERMFNIPNPEAEMDYQATRYIEPTLDMGEHVGDIITGGEFQSRIFKNPKSLDKFGNRFSRTVKAISLENGDLYVAEKDGYFYHGDILSILKLRGNHFMGWYANKHNNTFSLAMSSFDEKLVNHIKEMRDIVQKKFPQYKFHALNSNENK